HRDRDRFYTALFVPHPAREGLLAVYALNAELAHVHRMVSEEMIGHIRLAWWQETLDALYAGNVRQGQPMIEALAPVIEAGHMPQEDLTLLVKEYRSHYPKLPPDIDAVMKKLSIVYLRLTYPEAEPAWRKAEHIVRRHRRRYNKRMNLLLITKLLLAK